MLTNTCWFRPWWPAALASITKSVVSLAAAISAAIRSVAVFVIAFVVLTDLVDNGKLLGEVGAIEADEKGRLVCRRRVGPCSAQAAITHPHPFGGTAGG